MAGIPIGGVADAISGVFFQTRGFGEHLRREMLTALRTMESSLSPDNIHCQNLRKIYIQFRSDLNSILWNIDERSGQLHEAYATQYRQIIQNKVEKDASLFKETLMETSKILTDVSERDLRETLVTLLDFRQYYTPHTQAYCEETNRQIMKMRAMVNEEDVLSEFGRFWQTFLVVNGLNRYLARATENIIFRSSAEQFLDHTLTRQRYQPAEETDELVEIDVEELEDLFRYLDETVHAMEEYERLRQSFIPMYRQGIDQGIPSRVWAPPRQQEERVHRENRPTRRRPSQRNQGRRPIPPVVTLDVPRNIRM